MQRLQRSRNPAESLNKTCFLINADLINVRFDKCRTNAGHHLRDCNSGSANHQTYASDSRHLHTPRLCLQNVIVVGSSVIIFGSRFTLEEKKK